MRKKIVSVAICAIMTICLSLGMVSLGTYKAMGAVEVNAEGWVKADDGYYYDPNAKAMDLFEYHEDQSTGAQTNCDWYAVNYTGYIESGNFTAVDRVRFTTERNYLHSYFTKEWGENSQKEGLIAQYDWGKEYSKQSGCWDTDNNGTNATTRYMDFTFNLDFTKLTRGWINYICDATKITIDLDSNLIRVEETTGENGVIYTGGRTTNVAETYDATAQLKDLTGVHKVTFLIEDRVSESTAEITRNGNKGARVKVSIDDKTFTFDIPKMGYNAGICGIFNYTDDDLVFTSTKTNITFEENGGSEVKDLLIEKNVSFELPTTTRGAYVFDGWYTTSTFDVESEFTSEMAKNGVGKDTKLYAKWSVPTTTPGDNWVFNEEDGYFYNKEDKPMDLFDFHESEEDNGQTNCDFYIAEYTGSIDSQEIEVVDNSLLTYDNNVLPSGDMVVAMYDWDKEHFKQSPCWQEGYTNESIRCMDFVFYADFGQSGEVGGSIAYIYDSIKIEVIFADWANCALVQTYNGANVFGNMKGENKLKEYWGEKSATELSGITGVQKIVFHIKDRVVKSTDELKQTGSSGVEITVSVGNYTQIFAIDEVNYYAGCFAIMNNTNIDLTLLSAKRDILEEEINNYLDRTKYDNETLLEIDEYLLKAIKELKEKEIKEVNDYYVTVKTHLDDFLTIEQKKSLADKKDKSLQYIKDNYIESDYDENTWKELSLFLTEYENAIKSAKSEIELENVDNNYRNLAKKYLTKEESQETSQIIEELMNYASNLDLDDNKKQEIEIIKDEYKQDILNAPSIEGVRRLLVLAKEEIDLVVGAESGEDVSDDSTSSNRHNANNTGCSSAVNTTVYVGLLALFGAFILIKKHKKTM